MKKIRIGNDIAITLHVRHDGLPADFTDRRLTLLLVCGYRKMKVDNFTVDGDKVTFLYKGVEQETLGKYYITLYENYGEDSQNVSDTFDTFELVPRSTLTQEAAYDKGIVTVDVGINVELTSSDYGQLSGKPVINGVEVSGNKTLHDYGIQPEGEYATRQELTEGMEQVDADIEKANERISILESTSQKAIRLEVTDETLYIYDAELKRITFATTKNNQSVKLCGNRTLFSLIRIGETGEEIDGGTYVFEKAGKHDVYVKFNPDVEILYSAFDGCKELISINHDLFYDIIDAKNFTQCFYNCAGLTSIPKGLFDKCPNAEKMYNTFFGCSGLTSIPVGLFDKCPNVTNFVYCFGKCESLTNIPDTIFDCNIGAVSFDRCFSSCTGLKGSTPTDKNGYKLWERAGKEGYPDTVNGGLCFSNCTGLSDYDEIPSNWK